MEIKESGILFSMCHQLPFASWAANFDLKGHGTKLFNRHEALELQIKRSFFATNPPTIG